MKVSDGLSADSKAELLAMNRMLERTSGFALAFVAINHQALCEALINEYVSDGSGKILAVELHAVTVESIVRQITHCLDSGDGDRPTAIFVHGLEDMLELAGTRLQYIEDLNYSRTYCSKRFPFPLVFWSPEYVIRDFSYRAQDLWSCRSDVYYVEGDLDDIRETVSDLRARLDELLKSPERAGEVRALRSLLHDVRRELAQSGDPRSHDRKDECDELTAEIEEQLADLAGYAGKLDERKYHLQRTFDITKIRNDLKVNAHKAQRLGQITLEMDLYGEARDRYQEALYWYLEIGDKRGQSECHYGLGLVSLMVARYEDAEWLFSEGLRIAREESYTKGHADGCKGLGHVARLLGHNNRARGWYQQAMRLYSEIPDEIGRGNCLEGLADIAWARSDYDQAQTLYNQALRIAQENYDKRGEAGRKEGLGHVAIMLADYNRADNLYNEALQIYRAIPRRRGEANTIRGIGEVARVRDNDDKAKEYFGKALSIYRDIGHRRGEADAIRGLGHIARERGEYGIAPGQDEDAEVQYKKALAIYTEIGFRWGQAACAEALGKLRLVGEKYPEAESQYKHAMKLSHAIENRKGEAAALRGLGDSAWALDDYDAAAKYYKKAQEISARIDDGPGEAAFIRDRGDAAWVQGRFGHAAKLYREALDRSIACDDRWGEADSNRKLGNIAWRKRDYVEATHLYDRAWTMYRQLGARRLEAECLIVLGRLPVASADPEFVYGDNPAETRKTYTKDATRILTSIKAMDRAKEVSSDATLDELIQDIYAKHWRQGDRSDHRVL